MSPARTTTTVPLSGGHVAVLRDPRTVTHGERQEFIRAAQGLPQSPLRDALAAELLVALFLECWTFAQPLPSAEPGGLDDIPAVDMATLAQAAAQAAEILFPDVGPSREPSSLCEQLRRLSVRLAGRDSDCQLEIDPEILGMHRDLALAEVLKCSVLDVARVPARLADLALATHNAQQEAAQATRDIR